MPLVKHYSRTGRALDLANVARSLAKQLVQLIDSKELASFPDDFLCAIPST